MSIIINYKKMGEYNVKIVSFSGILTEKELNEKYRKEMVEEYLSREPSFTCNKNSILETREFSGGTTWRIFILMSWVPIEHFNKLIETLQKGVSRFSHLKLKDYDKSFEGYVVLNEV